MSFTSIVTVSPGAALNDSPMFPWTIPSDASLTVLESPSEKCHFLGEFNGISGSKMSFSV